MNYQKLGLIFIVLFVTFLAQGQDSYVGKSLSEVKSYTNYEEEQSDCLSETKYKDGILSQVELLYLKKEDDWLGFTSTYYVIFYIKNDICTHIEIDYTNMSKEKLKEYYDKGYKERHLSKYYFSNDYKTYRTLSENVFGDALVTIKRTEVNKLPTSIRTKVTNKIKESEEKALKGKEQREAEKKAKEAILSKVYNLKDIAPEKYDAFVEELKNNFIEGLLKSNQFPSWNEVENKYKSSYTYQNVYGAHYQRKREDGNYYFTEDNHFTLISGENKSFGLIKAFSPKVPSAKVKGVEVDTELKIEKFPMSYTKGVAVVTVKNGNVSFVGNVPNDEIKEFIMEKAKSFSKGRYKIKYKYVKVMGETRFISTEEKIASTGSKLLKGAVNIVY